VRVAKCEKCGKQFEAGSRGKLSTQCMECKNAERSRAARAQRTVGFKFVRHCLACQQQFATNTKKTLHCSLECAGKRRRNAEKFNCLNCEKQFQKEGGKNFNMYCSRKCVFEHMRKKKNASGIFGLRDLEAFCKKLLSQERLHEQKRMTAIRSLVNFCARLIKAESKAICKHCGKFDESLIGTKKSLCSEECKRLQSRKLKPKGSKKHTTRAKKRGLPRQYSITLPKVAERDGWICKLCCVPVEKGLHSHDPKAGCIDHIVPLNFKANTQHGHTWSNVQLAHRDCNEKKGCSIACLSLVECDDPRNHIRQKRIDQTPPTGVEHFATLPFCPTTHATSARISEGCATFLEVPNG